MTLNDMLMLAATQIYAVRLAKYIHEFGDKPDAEIRVSMMDTSISEAELLWTRVVHRTRDR